MLYEYDTFCVWANWLVMRECVHVLLLLLRLLDARNCLLCTHTYIHMHEFVCLTKRHVCPCDWIKNNIIEIALCWCSEKRFCPNVIDNSQLELTKSQAYIGVAASRFRCHCHRCHLRRLTVHSFSCMTSGKTMQITDITIFHIFDVISTDWFADLFPFINKPYYWHLLR